jgi:imidazolonepropionase-like amidohydrolase
MRWYRSAHRTPAGSTCVLRRGRVRRGPVQGGATVATLLPGADFSTRNKYPDARSLIDAGVTVALAADCNPGTCYTTCIPFCITLAIREMHMSPEEALWAATAGGAAALQRNDIGRIAVGARADLIALDAPSYLYLAIARAWRSSARCGKTVGCTGGSTELADHPFCAGHQRTGSGELHG